MSWCQNCLRGFAWRLAWLYGKLFFVFKRQALVANDDFFLCGDGCEQPADAAADFVVKITSWGVFLRMEYLKLIMKSLRQVRQIKW